jgi:hypothetical protein
MGIQSQLGKAFLVVAIGLIASGCDSSGSAGSAQDMNAMATAATTERDAKQQQADEAAKAEAERQAAEASANPPQPARKEAGRGSIGEGGYLVAIAGARRHVLNQVDDLAWTQAVQHFQAEHGRLPKDHNEFMTRIIAPLEINLGYIEEGQEFLYDPTPTQEHPWGTLYVVEKQQPPAQP